MTEGALQDGSPGCLGSSALGLAEPPSLNLQKRLGSKVTSMKVNLLWRKQIQRLEAQVLMEIYR